MSNNTSTITYCETPVITVLMDWLNDHIGRISVGIRRDDHFEIIAYSDNDDDSDQLRKYAKQRGAKYINSIDNRGITAID